MLSIKPLRCFIAVAEQRHFSRAADSLFVTQSALSVQIINLEKALGTRLLNRNKRSSVTLTVAGKLFLVEAKAVIAKLEHAQEVGRRAGRGEIGHINIGYVASAAFSGVLPLILNSFRDQAPDVTLTLQEMSTPSQLQEISRERLDVGFLRPRTDLPSGINQHLIHSEGLYLALPAAHALAANEIISTAQLINETFIEPQFDEPVGFEKQVASILGTDTYERRHLKTRDFMTAVTLVASGYGVAIVPKSVSCLALDNVAFRLLKNDVSTAELAIAFRDDENSDAVAMLIGIAKSSFNA